MAPGFLLTWYHTTASTNLEAFFDCMHGWAHCRHNRILLLHHEEGEACTASLHTTLLLVLIWKNSLTVCMDGHIVAIIEYCCCIMRRGRHALILYIL